jgi:hypothetical protein
MKKKLLIDLYYGTYRTHYNPNSSELDTEESDSE